MNKLKVREVWISLHNPYDANVVPWFKDRVVFVKDLREVTEDILRDLKKELAESHDIQSFKTSPSAFAYFDGYEEAIELAMSIVKKRLREVL